MKPSGFLAKVVNKMTFHDEAIKSSYASPTDIGHIGYIHASNLFHSVAAEVLLTGTC